jgi:peptidoglycan hydrolase-like protein with peptidoglycan-binding domain
MHRAVAWVAVQGARAVDVKGDVMSESRRAPYRVTGLDEFGLPAEPPPLPPPPPPGVAALSRRGLITALGGLTLGASALVPGLFASDRIRELASQQLTGEPPIYDCASWGAREPTSPVTVLNAKPSRILVHHTATANVTDYSAAALGQLARSIQAFHMKDRGWLDTGQNFTISRGGYIAEGRHESLQTLLSGAQFVEGAQCPNQNDSSIGIENEGTYTAVQPPAVLFSALTALCAFACRQYGLAPTQLFGHRDYWDTECPGDRLYALLPALRSRVAQAMGAMSSGHTPGQQVPPGSLAPPNLGRLASARRYNLPSWPLLRVDDRGGAVLAAQYLLRGAGVPGVHVNGQFDRYMVDAVYVFQRRHHLPVTGMIGGGSWPLLAVPVRAGHGGDAELAVHSLTTSPSARGFLSRVPTTVTRTTWQRLLTAAAPTS